MSDGCPDCQHSLTIHDTDGCGVPSCDCTRQPPKEDRHAH